MQGTIIYLLSRGKWFLFYSLLLCILGFPDILVVKNPPASARDVGSIPGSGSSPGKGNGNPLQYSCLESSMDRGAWHVVAKSDTTERLSTHRKHIHGVWRSGHLGSLFLPSTVTSSEPWVKHRPPPWSSNTRHASWCYCLGRI